MKLYTPAQLRNQFLFIMKGNLGTLEAMKSRLKNHLLVEELESLNSAIESLTDLRSSLEDENHRKMYRKRQEGVNK